MENNIKTQIEKLDEICPLVKGYKNSKRLVRVNFFENIETELQAYLLGFHVADGSFNEKRSTFTIRISEIDKEVIEWYKYISPDAYYKRIGVRKFIGPSGKEIVGQPSVRLDISNKKIGESLIKLGYGQNKTYKEMFLPELPDELLWHFIRGYFDGDGCFMLYCRKPNVKNRSKNFRIVAKVEWVSKTKSLLIDIQNFLLKYGISSHLYNPKDCYRLMISSKSCVKKLYEFLYKDSNFRMSRKYNKYNYYVNTEESQIITDLRNA